MQQDIQKTNLTLTNKILRVIWKVVYVFLFRPFATKLFRRWRNLLLRLFGAKIHKNAGIYASATIWAPWNLHLGDNAWIGPKVNCYNVDIISLGKNATISQGAHLCTASHNIMSVDHELITAPIILKDEVWVAVDSYIHMGVTIGQGAVVGATASVYKDVDAWTVVGGNPAKFIKKRII